MARKKYFLLLCAGILIMLFHEKLYYILFFSEYGILFSGLTLALMGAFGLVIDETISK